MKSLSTDRQFRFKLVPMPASKDNIKAFFIVSFYVALLVVLLLTANHFRPHP